MSSHPKLFQDFLSLQHTFTQPKEPERKHVIKPPKPMKMDKEELTFSYIVSKKPKQPKVLKYLQNMIDDIIAENED